MVLVIDTGKQLRLILEDFAGTFAHPPDPYLGWWGKDTDLGDCEEAFDTAIDDIIELFKDIIVEACKEDDQ
jgi:hypothetical protein